MIGAVPISCGMRCYVVAELLLPEYCIALSHTVHGGDDMIVLAALAFFFLKYLPISIYHPSSSFYSRLSYSPFNFFSLVVNRYDDEYDYNLPII